MCLLVCTPGSFPGGTRNALEPDGGRAAGRLQKAEIQPGTEGGRLATRRSSPGGSSGAAARPPAPRDLPATSEVTERPQPPGLTACGSLKACGLEVAPAVGTADTVTSKVGSGGASECRAPAPGSTSGHVPSMTSSDTVLTPVVGQLSALSWPPPNLTAGGPGPPPPAGSVQAATTAPPTPLSPVHQGSPEAGTVPEASLLV